MTASMESEEIKGAGAGTEAARNLSRAPAGPRGLVGSAIRAFGDLYQRWARVVMVSEARWTMPTQKCPHPEWWHRGVWEGTELEVREFLAVLVRALQPELVVETGSAYGQTTETLGRALRANGHGRIITVELDPERCEITRRRCAGLPVEVANVDSMQFTPPGTIGFAFFDSLPRIRALEFRRYRPWISPGTIVAFHDGELPRLREGVEALVADGLVRAVYFPTPKGLALCEVLPGPG